MSEDGRTPSDAQRYSALYEDAVRVVRLLEAQAASNDTDAISEIKELCQGIVDELPLTPWEDPPVFKVKTIDQDDWLITCQICSNGFIVHGETWIKGGDPEEGSRSTRVCPYCGYESYLIDRRPQFKRVKDP